MREVEVVFDLWGIQGAKTNKHSMKKIDLMEHGSLCVRCRWFSICRVLKAPPIPCVNIEGGGGAAAAGGGGRGGASAGWPSSKKKKNVKRRERTCKETKIKRYAHTHTHTHT